MTLTAAVAAVVLSAASTSCPPPPLRSGPLPWKAGETLGYEFDLMGVVKAGTASLTVERPILGQFHVQGRMRNTSVFAKVRRLTGTALSWMDPKTLRPARYREEVMDNGVRKRTDARFPERSVQTTIEMQVGDEKKSASFPREAEVADMLSLVYTLRAADLRPGNAICFDLVANRRLWRLRATVAPKLEQVESAAGIFDALRVDGTATRADDPAEKRPLHIWISSDARRLPLAAVSEIELGPVRAMLSRISP